MSLDPPTYLSSLQNNIRARPIPWDGAVRAGTLSQEQLNLIKAVDKVRKEQRKQTLEADLDSYRTLFLGSKGTPSVFQSVSKRVELVQYLLVLLGDLLDGKSIAGTPALCKALLDHENPYGPFLPLLSHSTNPEDPVPLLTSTVLSSLLAAAAAQSTSDSSTTDKALPKLFTYLSSLATSADNGLKDIAMLQYSAVLRSRKARQAFWVQKDETVAPLMTILKGAAGVSSNGDSGSTLWSGASSIRSGIEGSVGGGVGLQLLYHVLLVVWQLSFEGSEVGPGLEEDFDVIALYTQLLRISPKEKTTRLLVSTLLNLLSTNEKTLLPSATLARLPALLQNVNGRHLSDPDLVDDVSSLSDLLEEHTKTQTTFDEYLNEVTSGHLRWSPPHRSPTFWAENARKILEYEKGEIPRKLAEIMAKPWDTDKEVLAIGCNDVGCLVKEVPEKRQQLEKLGLKTRTMELMAEPNEHVRWESLKAVGEWLRYSFETK